MQWVPAWLLQRSLDILLIPGTPNVEHLHENLAAVELHLANATLKRPNGIYAKPDAI